MPPLSRQLQQHHKQQLPTMSTLLPPIDRKLIMCLQCGVQFKYAKALKAHMTECGVTAKCPFCPIILKHRQMLVEHVETHRPGYCP